MRVHKIPDFSKHNFQNIIKLSFLVVGLIGLLSLAHHKDVSAIVNGEVVAYPWAVAFALPNDGNTPIEGRTYCSGVLVKANWVLTAGHCQPAIGNLAIVGRSRLASTAGEVKRVEDVKYMRDSETYCNQGRIYELCDIALVRLDTPSNQQDADLADNDVVAEWGVGSTARSYGYGWTSLASQMISTHLRRQTSTITDLRDNHFTLFAVSSESSVCHGDSGGPLIVSTSEGPRVVAITRAPTSTTPQWLYCGVGHEASYVKVGYRGSLSSSRPFYWIQSIVN